MSAQRMKRETSVCVSFRWLANRLTHESDFSSCCLCIAAWPLSGMILILILNYYLHFNFSLLLNSIQSHVLLLLLKPQ